MTVRPAVPRAPPPAPPAGASRRLLTVALVLVCFTPALLLLALNLLLNTSLRVLLNPQPERARITWRSAWSLWPGEVHVDGLRLRIQDPDVQIEITAEHARGTIDLWALTEDRFVADAIRAEGATFRIRHRRALVEAIAEATAPAASVAPIPGLDNPPTIDPERVYGPPARVFRVQLTDLQVEDVREIWVEEHRFEGRARVAGDLDLLSHRWVAVDQLLLALDEGVLTTGGRPVMDQLSGRVAVHVTGVNPDDHPGQAVLGYVSGELRLDAQVKDLSFLAYSLRKAPWLAVAGGAGPLRMDVQVEDGRVREGSSLEVDARAITARLLSYGVSGDGRVRVDLVPAAGRPEGRLALDFLDYTIHRDGDPSPHVRGRGLRVEARSEDVSLAEPFAHLDVSVVIPEAVIPDARVYQAYLPSGVGLHLDRGAGVARGELHASTTTNLAHGDLFLDGAGVQGRFGSVALRADLSLHAHLVGGDLLRGRYDVAGSSLRLRDVAVVGPPNTRRGKDDSHGWWADVEVPEADIAVGQPVFFDGRVRTRLRDSVPFVTIFSEASTLPPWARGLLKVRDLAGEARIQLGDDTLVLPRFVLAGVGSEVRLRLRNTRGVTRGSLLARSGPLSLGLALDESTSTPHLVDAQRWYDAQAAP